MTSDRPAWHLSGIGPYDVGVPGCWFFRLPHKSGVDNNVGNPLAKDYLNKIEDGTLQATSSTAADRILKLNRNIIYWRNARDRITSQMVVWLQPSQLPNSVTASEHFDPTGSYGAIVPQVKVYIIIYFNFFAFKNLISTSGNYIGNADSSSC